MKLLVTSPSFKKVKLKWVDNCLLLGVYAYIMKMWGMVRLVIVLSIISVGMYLSQCYKKIERMATHFHFKLIINLFQHISTYWAHLGSRGVKTNLKSDMQILK